MTDHPHDPDSPPPMASFPGVATFQPEHMFDAIASLTRLATVNHPHGEEGWATDVADVAAQWAEVTPLQQVGPSVMALYTTMANYIAITSSMLHDLVEMVLEDSFVPPDTAAAMRHGVTPEHIFGVIRYLAQQMAEEGDDDE